MLTVAVEMVAALVCLSMTDPMSTVRSCQFRDCMTSCEVVRYCAVKSITSVLYFLREMTSAFSTLQAGNTIGNLHMPLMIS